MTLAAAQVFRPPPPGRGAVIVAAGGVAMAIDWAALRAAATEVAQRAYAPYSGLRVGAAGETGDGRVVVGCNVENASYGLTLCAECGLVSALHTAGGGSLAAVSVVSGDGQHLLPCGRCRQLLLEAGGLSMLVDTGAGPIELSRLLPSPFTQADLAAAVDDDD
jgi:cytidine deaminase